jgi:uncharacterized protein YegP (UPF0339 family)
MSIHLMLQGKGGVGKSLASSILAQFLISKGNDVFCADTDPVNDTFSRYTAFPVESVRIMDAMNNIDTRQFDGLIEKLIAYDGQAVVDNGASTFVPLTSYLVDSFILKTLEDMGKRVVLHTVITGGQALQDTLTGLNSLLKAQTSPIVVWENEYFGKVVKNGKTFLESELYKQNKDRILGVVKIDKRSADTYGRDMEMLASNMLTFEQAQTSDLFTLIPRIRLSHVQKALFEQLDTLEL